MDRYKFDLRVYVLVISCDPLRLFLYNDGLVSATSCAVCHVVVLQVRLSTEHYAVPSQSNLVSIHMSQWPKTNTLIHYCLSYILCYKNLIVEHLVTCKIGHQYFDQFSSVRFSYNVQCLP